MKMPFDGWVIYDRIDGAWQVAAIVPNDKFGFEIKELVKSGLAMKSTGARCFTHKKDDSIAWRMGD
jgi:hypothetical protein